MKDISDIGGATRLYAIIADPIHHVKTPQLMNELFKIRILYYNCNDRYP